MAEKLIRAEEVALTVGISVQTINTWYVWKFNNPNHELADLLPDFIQENPRQIRYWRYGDIWKLIEFKKTIPHGRNGILGSVTQKYVKK